MSTCKEVLAAEQAELEAIRARAEGQARLKNQTVGLAFSGGGIRSATFHLGILQTLAKYGLLKQFDYLSTVSGGGYIGGWLARWIQKVGMDDVEKQLPAAHEPPEVNFLRDYSNFLTPRKGLLGADTWAAIATYLRNLLLNQSILATFLGALLVLPWLCGSAFPGGPLLGVPPFAWSFLAGLASIFALAAGVVHTSTCCAGTPPKFTHQPFVLLSVVLPLFVGAFLLTYAVWRVPDAWDLGFSVEMGVLVYGLGHLAGWVVSKALRKNAVADFWNVVWAVPAGAFGGVGIYGLARLLKHWSTGSDIGLWHAVSWGPPLAVLVFLLAGTLHTGLAKFALTFEMHEWWARLGGWLLLWSVFWSAIFAVAIFAPRGVERFIAYLPTKLTLLSAWAAHSGYGALLGWGKDTSGKKPNEPQATHAPVKELVAKAAPFVFVAGLLVLLASGVHALVAARSGGPGDYWTVARNFSNCWLWMAFALLFFLAVFISWRVDINRFSLNLVYRNRIVRCYLGASNPERNAQPFTGFDPGDDACLSSFAQGGNPDRAARPYTGPYPILNSTLNVTHGKRLAWQERKAESFVFTPLYCGYDFPEIRPETNPSSTARAGAYQPTCDWAFPHGGIPLGSAIAVSGAAVNPNCGYHTFPPLAFLMTVFNARLGVWLANSRFRNDQYKIRRPQGGPGLSLLYLLNELFATATDESKYINLSDGAHFENLALYELVRRECDFIVSGDAGEDPGMRFEDLVNAIRKCRTDLGAEVTLKPDPFQITAADGFAKAHMVLGSIVYASGKKGQLLYFKTCLTGRETEDVLAYKRAHAAFPHQSTANQWFDESQFESYRMLGRLAMQAAVDSAGPLTVKAGGIPALFRL